jgi:hypothetical protein
MILVQLEVKCLGFEMSLNSISVMFYFIEYVAYHGPSVTGVLECKFGTSLCVVRMKACLPHCKYLLYIII